MSIGNERGLELFTKAGALLSGHFRLNAGDDGLRYVAKDLLWKNDPEAAREICQGIAEDFFIYEIEAVVGPKDGAVWYADCTAEILSQLTGKPVRSVHAQKCIDGSKNFYFEEADLVHVRDKRVLIVEDVFTTGGSCARTITLVENSDGKVIAVGGVWNRGAVTKEDLGVEVFISQINEQIPTFQPGAETCQGCKEELPYDLQWGHGKKLIGEHPLAIKR